MDINKEEAVTVFLLINAFLSLVISYYATLFTNSIAIQNDFLSYILDIAYYTVICFLSFKIHRSNELTYNYGTGKIEAGVFLFTSMLIVIYVIYVAIITYIQFIEMVPLTYSHYAVILYVVMIIKNVLTIFIVRKILTGKETLLVSSGVIYTISCIIDNLIVLIPLFSFALFEDKLELNIYVDIFCGGILAVSNLYVVYPMLKKSVSQLSDRALNESVQLKILSVIAKHYDRFNYFVNQKSREDSHYKYIELYIEFDGQEAHDSVMDTIYEIKRDIEASIPHSIVDIIPAKYEKKS